MTVVNCSKKYRKFGGPKKRRYNNILIDITKRDERAGSEFTVFCSEGGSVKDCCEYGSES
jgi:hypothetical protein